MWEAFSIRRSVRRTHNVVLTKKHGPDACVRGISLLILGVEFAIVLTLLQVRHLHWGGQDQTLVSCGQDGAVYQWDVDEAKRLREFVQKGTAYSCALR